MIVKNPKRNEDTTTKYFPRQLFIQVFYPAKFKCKDKNKENEKYTNIIIGENSQMEKKTLSKRNQKFCINK
jgi:hypothetical protein